MKRYITLAALTALFAPLTHALESSAVGTSQQAAVNSAIISGESKILALQAVIDNLSDELAQVKACGATGAVWNGTECISAGGVGIIASGHLGDKNRTDYTIASPNDIALGANAEFLYLMGIYDGEGDGHDNETEQDPSVLMLTRLDGGGWKANIRSGYVSREGNLTTVNQKLCGTSDTAADSDDRQGSMCVILKANDTVTITNGSRIKGISYFIFGKKG